MRTLLQTELLDSKRFHLEKTSELRQQLGEMTEKIAHLQTETEKKDMLNLQLRYLKVILEGYNKIREFLSYSLSTPNCDTFVLWHVGVI